MNHSQRNCSKAGMSNGAASVTNDTLSLVCSTVAASTIINSGPKAFTRLSSNSQAGLAKTMDPNIIRFSQNSISNKFRDGRFIDDIANSLKSGSIKINVIQSIRLVSRNNMLFILDNRRLEAFRRAGGQVPYRMATPEEIAAEMWKFTSSNGGTSIHIRGK